MHVFIVVPSNDPYIKFPKDFDCAFLRAQHEDKAPLYLPPNIFSAWDSALAAEGAHRKINWRFLYYKQRFCAEQDDWQPAVASLASLAPKFKK